MIGVINDKVVKVYSEPRSESEVIWHIAEGNIVQIDETESVGKFYKIYMAMGIEGYCKKKHISIQR